MQWTAPARPFLRGPLLHTVLLTIALLVAGGGAPAEAQDNAVEDFFFARDGEAAVRIALDEIGVQPPPGFSEDEINAFAENNDYTVERRLGNQFVVFGLPNTRPREQLVGLARDLKQTEEFVRQAGLVATPEEADTPLILTDQFVARFRAGVDRSQIESLNAQYGVEVLMPDRSEANVLLLAATEQSGQDALELSQIYHESPLTEFSEPNFLVFHQYRQTIPNDPFFGNQWHHRNTGQNGGAADADVDTPTAWDITMGSAGTVVAVIDNGFDVDGPNPHPDLAPNLWQNPSETPGNNTDDDGNTYADDVNGWDFGPCSGPSPSTGCGDNTLAGGRHGTSTAGAVAAEANNGLGVSGTCPDCSLMLVQQGQSFFGDRLAFQYARGEGADLISNSWGYPVGTPQTNTVTNAINSAATAGSMVFFAMTNGPYSEDCRGATSDISSLQSVFAVAASNNLDTRSPSGYGDCMEMVAPTLQGASVGTLGATTTDVQGSGGYNPSLISCPTGDLGNNDYTRCFGGTSFATPVTAGVAGLLFSENPGLTRTEVRRLLQDTGNKIQDSRAEYDPETGFSAPGSGPSGGLPAASLHGFGRVNAAEAVRVADQGVDVFVRDNRLDWGNTEQPSSQMFPSGYINWWQSVDTKVDAPPYQLSSGPVTASDFAGLKNEDPISGLKNRVYVRVRNRGPSAASNVKVTLRYGFAGTSLPRWPTGWGSSQTIGQKTISTVPYSGSSVAGGAGDPAEVVQFDWTAPAPKTGQPSPNHFCLLTELSGVSADPSSPPSGPLRNVVPTENNFSLDNLSVVNTTTTTGVYADSFYVANPYDQPIDTEVTLDVPVGWDVALRNVPAGQSITLDQGERRLAILQVYPPPAVLNGEETGEVQVRQAALFGENERQVVGGLTYRYRQREGLVAGSGLTVTGDGLVDFGDTGLDILFSGVTGEGPIVVRRFNEGPSTRAGIAEENVSSYRFAVDDPGPLPWNSAQLRFDVSRLAGIEAPEDVVIYKSGVVGGRDGWIPLATTYNSEEGTLTATVSSFSEFVFASDADPLPVEMAAFDATVTDDATVELSWTTASETGNAGFRVQRRAADGTGSSAAWTTIGRVEGRGTADASTTYAYLDDDLPYAADSLSYRLKQVDTDGAASFTDPITVRRTVDAVRLRAPFPNPASQRATLHYALPRPQEVTIGLYDVLGRRVRTIERGRRQGRQQVRLDVSGLSSGVYVLRLEAGTTVKTKRLTVAH